MAFTEFVSTNLTDGMFKVVKNLDIGIRPFLIFPEDWESLVEPDQFVALVYALDDDRFIEQDQVVIQIDLYGDGVDATLNKAFEMHNRLVWDPHGSSYHFFEGGMIDDVFTRGRPALVPTDQDRVALVTSRYTMTIRV